MGKYLYIEKTRNNQYIDFLENQKSDRLLGQAWNKPEEWHGFFGFIQTMTVSVVIIVIVVIIIRVNPLAQSIEKHFPLSPGEALSEIMNLPEGGIDVDIASGQVIELPNGTQWGKLPADGQFKEIEHGDERNGG